MQDDATKTLLTPPHSSTVCSKTANINVKKLTSLKLIVRTTWWYHSTKTAKIFWVTLDVAMHGAAYGRPMRSPIYSVTQKIFAVLVEW